MNYNESLKSPGFNATILQQFKKITSLQSYTLSQCWREDRGQIQTNQVSSLFWPVNLISIKPSWSVTHVLVLPGSPYINKTSRLHHPCRLVSMPHSTLNLLAFRAFTICCRFHLVNRKFSLTEFILRSAWMSPSAKTVSSTARDQFCSWIVALRRSMI